VLFLRDDGVLLVGDAANRRAVVEPARVAREFKRRVGDTTPFVLAGDLHAPQALTGHVIRWVVERVSEQEDSPPDHETLTCPAHWGDHRRGLMEEAAAAADLSAPGLLTEPHAAAVHYAAQERIPSGAIVGVYDLGGGTFDAAVLRKTAAGFELLGTPAGVPDLGGVDFDQAVIAHVRETLGDRWPTDHGGAPAGGARAGGDLALQRAMAQVHAAAVDAKEALSSDTIAQIPVILLGYTGEVRITRAEFEERIRPWLRESVAVFEETLRDAGIKPDDLHAVLLTGGSSRIPLVAELLAGSLRVHVTVDAHPKFAVSLGAAITAAARLAPDRPTQVVRAEPLRDEPAQREDQRMTIASRPLVDRRTVIKRPGSLAPTVVSRPGQQLDVNLRHSGLTRAGDTPLRSMIDRPEHMPTIVKVTSRDDSASGPRDEPVAQPHHLVATDSRDRVAERSRSSPPRRQATSRRRRSRLVPVVLILLVLVAAAAAAVVFGPPELRALVGLR
jgi:actin-like ATPase involved in cell morphogenesis